MHEGGLWAWGARFPPVVVRADRASGSLVDNFIFDDLGTVSPALGGLASQGNLLHGSLERLDRLLCRGNNMCVCVCVCARRVCGLNPRWVVSPR